MTDTPAAAALLSVSAGLPTHYSRYGITGHDALSQRTHHKLTNKQTNKQTQYYVYELAVIDAKQNKNSTRRLTQPCSEL